MLVHRGDTVTPIYGENARNLVWETLNSKGIEVRLKTAVIGASKVDRQAGNKGDISRLLLSLSVRRIA